MYVRSWRLDSRLGRCRFSLRRRLFGSLRRHCSFHWRRCFALLLLGSFLGRLLLHFCLRLGSTHLHIPIRFAFRCWRIFSCLFIFHVGPSSLYLDIDFGNLLREASLERRGEIALDL